MILGGRGHSEAGGGMSSDGSPLLLNTSMMMSRTCQSQHSSLGQGSPYTAQVLKPLPLNRWEYENAPLHKDLVLQKRAYRNGAQQFLKTSLLLQTQQFSKCLIQKQRHSGKGPSPFQAQHSGTQLPPRSTTSVSSLFQKCHTYKIQKSKEL